VNGKGSKRRPRLVSQETLDENWDRIFAKAELADDDLNARIEAEEAALFAAGLTEEEVDAAIDNKFYKRF
jgi:hypothetical protein